MNKGRKKTGGKYIKNRKKKSYETKRKQKITKLGEEKRKEIGNKLSLLKAKFVNIPIQNKTTKVEIKNVLHLCKAHHT